jgi:hypothetical protein
MLPHLRKANRDKDKEEQEPFVSLDHEMAKAYAETHPQADPDYYVPAHQVKNTELEAPEEKTDDDKKDSE